MAACLTSINRTSSAPGGSGDFGVAGRTEMSGFDSYADKAGTDWNSFRGKTEDWTTLAAWRRAGGSNGKVTNVRQPCQGAETTRLPGQHRYSGPCRNDARSSTSQSASGKTVAMPPRNDRGPAGDSRPIRLLATTNSQHALTVRGQSECPGSLFYSASLSDG
jgi:hypothetical protein